MVRLLNPNAAGTIADAVVEVLESDGGYGAEEIIPGLIQAILIVASNHPHTEQLLDEAANLLADG